MVSTILALKQGIYQGFVPTAVTDPQAIGYIGDELLFQSGSTEPYDLLVTNGQDASKLDGDGLVGRKIALNGTTVPNTQAVIDGWRQQGFDPGTFIIALGSNDSAATDATWTSQISAVLDYIAAGPGSAYTVYWLDLAFGNDPTGTSSIATRFKNVLNALVGSRAKITLIPLDWNGYVHNGRSETGLWAVDAANKLMTTAGYTLRNQYVADQVRPTGPPPGASWKWTSSAIEGGGFQNAVAVSPFKRGSVRPIVLGADVSGPFQTENGAQQWTPVGGGAGNISGSARISSYMWADDTPGKVFAAEDGGIWMSTDWGKSWKKRGGTYNYDGNGATSPEHPRATGFLLGQDNSTATKWRWAATYTQGLKASKDDFNTVFYTLLAGYPMRSLAVNPNNPDELWVAVNRGTAAQNGLWHITNARSATPTATKVTGYPGTVATPVGVEELLCVKEGSTTYLYVAGHQSGMFRLNVNTNTWATINNGLAGIGNSVYRSVTVDPTNPLVLYCGCWHPNLRRAIFKTTDRGNTWVPITGPNPVEAPAVGPFVINWDMYGQPGDESWLRDIAYHSFAGPNQDWLAACLQVDPDNPNKIYAAGRGGCWIGTYDPVNSRWTWQPGVHGLNVTVCMTVTADELTTGRALLGNMDYQSVFTPDGGLSANVGGIGAPGSTGDVTCCDMSVTVGPSTFYAGVSQRGQGTGVGGIYSSNDPENGMTSTWTYESSGAFNTDVVGLAVGKNASGTRVILAVTSNSPGATQGGLWMKVGNTWSQRRSGVPGATSATGADQNQATLRWKRNSQTVYAHDTSGVWRSDDAGLNWTLIYSTGYSGYGLVDSIVIDPSDATKLYVSSGGVVRRINNANTAGAGGATVVTLWTGSAGNLAINPDGSQLFVNIRDGRIMLCTNFRTAASQTAANWQNIASGIALTHSPNIRSMACLKGGVIMTADNGSGALRGAFE
jgi:hypothetical protein